MTAQNKVNWNPSETPQELIPSLEILGESYPVSSGKRQGIALSFVKQEDSSELDVRRQGRKAEIRYSKPIDALRGVGAVLSGLAEPGDTYREGSAFDSLGIMLDVSRNAVMTVDHLKKWLRQLALLGYNQVMLYTEDVYELPGEPYFGYQRGAYTAAELKAIVSYASQLHIEVVPCIQTLGHLEHILKHAAYQDIRDNPRVLLVGEEKSYQLIRKMINHWKGISRSKRIHIGMDETFGLGLGKYLQLHGYRSGFELFNAHLRQVTAICKEAGLEPMIWSDMYFRLGSKNGDYYDRETAIPREVINQIPADVNLVYWDYYHSDKSFYLDWIEKHRQMKKEPIVASGIWTWNKYWYDHGLTEANAYPCIEACREAKVRELVFTEWGDNGAYCDHDSAFAGMVACADKAYGAAELSKARLSQRFAAVCGGHYSAHILASEALCEVFGFRPDMWDDPLFETKFRTWAKDSPATMLKAANHLAEQAARLKPHAKEKITGNMKYAWSTTNAFAKRYRLSGDLLEAYRNQDRHALEQVKANIPSVKQAIDGMARSLREMWMAHNKPEGIEVLQGRFGMLQARYTELQTRLGEYLKGRIPTVAELEYRCPPDQGI